MVYGRITVMQALQIEYREKREGGLLSPTLRKGWEIVVDGQAVWVSKLSWGWRCFLLGDGGRYQIIGTPKIVEVPKSLVRQARWALKRDLSFQEFCEKALGNS